MMMIKDLRLKVRLYLKFLRDKMVRYPKMFEFRDFYQL